MTPKGLQLGLHNGAICAVVGVHCLVQTTTPHPTRWHSGWSLTFPLDVAFHVASTADVPTYPDQLRSSQASQVTFTSTASKWLEWPVTY